jgi:hypothetical protein
MNKNSLKHILSLIFEGYEYGIGTVDEIEGKITYIWVKNPDEDPTNGDFVNYVTRLHEL